MELLLATGLSHPPAPALRVAVDIADRFDADLKLVHAPYPLPFEIEELGMTRGAGAEARKTTANDMRLRVRKLDLHREPETVVSPSRHPHEVILEESKKGPSALIVVGSAQRRGLGRFLARPSVAERVLDQTTRPVLVVPHSGAARLPKGAKILVAVDLGAGTTRILETAAAWARQLSGSLEVFHAHGVATGIAGVPRPGYFMVRQARSAEKWLAKAVASIAGPHLDVETIVRPAFNPGRAVIKAAEERGADLVVVGARRRGSTLRRWLGTPTSTILRLAEVPVLGIPTPPAGPARERADDEETY